MKYFDYYKDGKYEASGTIDELAARLDVSVQSVRHYFHKTKRHKIYHVADKLQVYALYSGDDIATFGSLHDIAEYKNQDVQSIKWLATPTGQERSNGNQIIIKLEDEYVIQRRTGVKYASVPSESKYDSVDKKKQIIMRPAPMKQFRVGEYAQYLHDSMFKGWSK